jgi:hypothetical protein
MKTLARLWIFLALAGLCTAAEALVDGDVFVRVRNAERLHVHLVPLAPFSWRHFLSEKSARHFKSANAEPRSVNPPV